MKKRFWQCAAAGAVAAGALVPATGAFAADYPDVGSTSTVQNDPGVNSAVQVAGNSSVQVADKTQARGQMPFTGGDVAALAVIGGGAVAIGGLLVVQTRKRRTLEAA